MKINKPERVQTSKPRANALILMNYQGVYENQSILKFTKLKIFQPDSAQK